MSRDWKAYWATRPAAGEIGIAELLTQVSKTRFGAPVPESQLTILADHIGACLPLSPAKSALDLGCGNGIVTALLAPRLAQVVGLDYSEVLLETARRHRSAPNIRYLHADLRDIARIDLPTRNFGVAWSVEVVQNLDPASLRALLRWLTSVMAPEFAFLASGIPNRARIRNFYDTPERWQLHLANEAAGEEQMGRWWDTQELAEAAADTGLRMTVRQLPDGYYTSSYRLDALFERC